MGSAAAPGDVCCCWCYFDSFCCGFVTPFASADIVVLAPFRFVFAASFNTFGSVHYVLVVSTLSLVACVSLVLDVVNASTSVAFVLYLCFNFSSCCSCSFCSCRLCCCCF